MMRMVTMVMGFPPLLIRLLTPAANVLVCSNDLPDYRILNPGQGLSGRGRTGPPSTSGLSNRGSRASSG